MSENNKYRPSPNHTGPSSHRPPVQSRSTTSCQMTSERKRSSTTSMTGSGNRTIVRSLSHALAPSRLFSIGSTSPDEGHFRRHNCQCGDVRIEGQICHVTDSAPDFSDVHRWLGSHAAICLGSSRSCPAAHIGRRIANVDLSTGNVERPSVKGG